ncbi:MAG TPA: magnesium transporter [Bacillota bacterium]|nr:magnesium transporter [Bacillota bacterium]
MVKLDKKTREHYVKNIMTALHEAKKEGFRNLFLDLHPSDQLDVFITLNNEERERVYAFLTPNEFADIFGGLDTERQKQFFLEMDETYAYNMFNSMFTDDVADFLTNINGTRAESILNNMDKDLAEKVRTLLSYAHETAGSIMTKELIHISSTAQVADVLEKLRHDAPDAEIIYYLYVVDSEKRLVGVVSLRDLIVAPPNAVIKDVMSTRVISVTEDVDQEDVGKMIKKYDLLALPVVSSENHLLGIVTVDDVMDILEEETTEDFGEISAVKGATDINMSAFAAARKRSPWIIALMFFGMITAGIVESFEETLEQILLLGAFVPMIMDSGGNVGTQSLTVAVRGLALGTVGKRDLWRMVRREFSTGMLIGLACMALMMILIPLIFGNWLVGIIVGVSIFLTLCISSVVGAVIPIVINKLKVDPAVASGPFITTINDILGLLIYFSIATALMDFL